MSGINIEVYRTTFANRVVYISNDLIQAYKDGYAAGLDAAREAVARLQHKPGASIANAVSAIDALRGSGNLDTPPSAEKGEKP